MTLKLAINGFGRIGRNVFRILQERNDIEVVAINDLTDPKTLAHLLKYDSVTGRFKGEIESDESTITVNGKAIDVLSLRDPNDLRIGVHGSLSFPGGVPETHQRRRGESIAERSAEG